MRATDFSVQQVVLSTDQPSLADSTLSMVIGGKISTGAGMLHGGGTIIQPKDPLAGQPDGSFLANVNVDRGISWRMVYDDSDVLALFESDGYTNTINNLFVADTKDECIAEAVNQGVTISEEILNGLGVTGAK